MTRISLFLIGLALFSAGNSLACPWAHLVRQRPVGSGDPSAILKTPLTPHEAALDKEFHDVVYPGGIERYLPANVAKADVLPFFDAYDVRNAVDFLQRRYGRELTDAEITYLEKVLRKRGHGGYGWSEWKGFDAQLKADGFGQFKAGDLDRAIAHATSSAVRPGVRLHIAREPGKPGFIDPELVPNHALIFRGGNQPITREEIAAMEKDANRLLTVQPGAKVTDGVMLLSDFHLLRPTGELDNYREGIKQLAKNPPGTLVIGGDLIDAPSFGSKIKRLEEALASREALEKLSPDEKALVAQIQTRRRQTGRGANEKIDKEEDYLVRREVLIGFALELRRALPPQSKIVFQFGNHDLPRVEAVPFHKDAPKTTTAFGVTWNTGGETGIAVPKIPLDARGQLLPRWHVTFAESLLTAIKARGGDASAVEKLIADLNSPQNRMRAEDGLVELARKFYAIKGKNIPIDEYQKSSYYDETIGDRLRAELVGHGFERLGVRSDKYFEVNVGTRENPKIILLSHEPQDSGPNAIRVVNLKHSVVGGQTVMTSPLGPVIGAFGFDQHTAASFYGKNIDGGADFGVHYVGSQVSATSNQGQALMGAVLDPKTGKVYHITLDDGAGNVGAPRMAPIKQINHIQPVRITNRVTATGTTTK